MKYPTTQPMTPDQFKTARRKLGLSVSELADMLGVDPVHVRRMEMQADKEAHRSVRETTERLLKSYLEGYRPKDWPA